jgi:hypothetical protein
MKKLILIILIIINYNLSSQTKEHLHYWFYSCKGNIYSADSVKIADFDASGVFWSNKVFFKIPEFEKSLLYLKKSKLKNGEYYSGIYFTCLLRLTKEEFDIYNK